ncbi:MAG: HEAT repeat domain-containing protein [Planctomycetes bacterium]|nr:HEAT repeat domain-containing protein [Planctomycetota bacterium]
MRTASLCLLVPVCLLTFELSAPAQEDLAQLLKSAQDPDPQERAKAVRAIAKIQTPEAAQVLVRLLADPHDYVHDEAIQGLTTFSNEEVFRFLHERALPGTRDLRTLAGIAAVIAELGLKPAVPNLVKALSVAREDAAVQVLRALARLADPLAKEAVAGKLRSPEWKTKTAALEAYAALAGEEAVEPVVAALSDPDFRARVAALQALAKVKPDRALEHARTLVADAHWSVQVAAIRVIERARDQASIPILVEQLRKEKGRLRKDLADALRTIASSQNDGEAADQSVVTYYGIQIYSKRVLFVTDLSQGMKEKAKGSSQSRIAIAQEEYINCLKGYPEDGYFNLVVFATEVAPWSPHLQRGVPVAKGQSADWLAKMVQSWIFARDTGRTNIYDALAACFDDPDVDTIVLLTDATTITEGTFRTKEDVLRRLGELNRYRNIQFHTIGIGKHEETKAARSLIKELAESTRGTFLETD